MIRLDNFECRLINFECLSWVILNVFYNRYIHCVSENGAVYVHRILLCKIFNEICIEFLINWEDKFTSFSKRNIEWSLKIKWINYHNISNFLISIAMHLKINLEN